MKKFYFIRKFGVVNKQFSFSFPFLYLVIVNRLLIECKQNVNEPWVEFLARAFACIQEVPDLVSMGT